MCGRFVKGRGGGGCGGRAGRRGGAGREDGVFLGEEQLSLRKAGLVVRRREREARAFEDFGGMRVEAGFQWLGL